VTFGGVIDTTNAAALTASARIDAGSVWFQGHFPDNPVLAGVGMLAFVEEVVAAARRAPPLVLVGFRHVRFRKIVRPGEVVTVSVMLPLSGECRFELHGDGEIACAGILVFTPGEEG
jgi:3-hydroxymyristoyl/3-hydroxydecanoyl-(acyl carrier protein) dehydratase